MLRECPFYLGVTKFVCDAVLVECSQRSSKEQDEIQSFESYHVSEEAVSVNTSPKTEPFALIHCCPEFVV